MDIITAHSESQSTNMEFVLKRSLMPKNKLALILKSEHGTQYCCVECPAKYDSKEQLEIHLCSHFREFRFLCGICGTGLKRKEHLDRHTLGHQEVRPHICPDCGKGFKRKEHLNIHRSIHSGDKTQICLICHRSFNRKDHLQKHLQTHNKQFLEQNIYPLSDQELMDIKQEVDDEDIKPIIDPLGCEGDMEVEERNGLVLENTPQFDPERPYACAVCHKTYKRKDHLKLHSQVHLKKEKTCSECGKAFHREEQLLVHMAVHLRPYQDDLPHLVENTNIEILPLEREDLLQPRVAKRPHECTVCHRRFKRKQHLKVHANVHLKSNPNTIWCSLCNEGFQTNYHFELHQCFRQSGSSDVTTPSDAKKENNHPTEFIQESQESDDLMSPIEEQLLPTPMRVYVCKYCGKPFKRKDHYKIHLHIHTGVKSFFCPSCDKGFYRKDHLQKHMQVHLKQLKATKLISDGVSQMVKEGKRRKEMPDLYPISLLKKDVRPEITITAPSNTKLRVPLQIKVPYQVVIAGNSGESQSVTIDPQGS